MPGRPVLLGALAWVVTLGVGRMAIVPPEHCPAVSAADARAAATAAVGWFTRNQLPDGQWRYRYDRDDDVIDERPHLVRHAGVTMSLYQAARAGIDGALEAADRGAEWALDQLVDTGPATGVAADRGTDRGGADLGGARAVEANGAVPTGGTALLVAGLAVRRDATGDPRYDDELVAMGRFLASMVEPSGAVLANWDPATGAPVPGAYSSYYTGEALWALSMLATVVPGGSDRTDWAAPAERIARYVSTDRDSAEDRFPPVSDHWAAYGLAQLALGADQPPDADERAYAERLAGIFGAQVRVESQRAAGGFAHATFRRGQASGAGLGTLGEGLGNLHRLEVATGGDDTDVLAERLACAAGVLVERQVDADDAATTGHPEAAEGAWFRDGVTQKDDQQHALSALLLAEPALDRGFAAGRSMDDPSVGRVLWLVLVAIAALNPVRPRSDGRARRATGRDLAVGAAVAGAVLAAVALAAPSVLRAVDISPSTAAMGAGVLVAVVAAADLLDRTPVPVATGWRGVVDPTFLRPAPTVLVLAVAAFDGTIAAIAAAAAIVAAAVVAAAVVTATVSIPARRALAWIVPAVAVLGGIDLFVHGLFSA